MSGRPLGIADFDEFFAAVNQGKAPFPWQRRLAATVCATGAWPGALDLPTGTGKTAVLDIAVFAMALDGQRPPAERLMARRAILVVDRRTIVDQGHVRARALADLVEQAAPDTLLGRVAASLLGLRGDGVGAAGAVRRARPLEVAHLRGAIPRDDGWARDPSQPMLGVSTVDQIGSRLLFRGYGVSSGMRSVHAGLLGNDVTYFLDEVHLSQPFAETLAQVQRWRERSSRVPLPPFQVVAMSATHRGEVAATFELDADDRQHEVLRRRLEVKKPATLEVVKVSGDESRRRAAFAHRLADLALAARSDRHQRIAVVVNRVNTALAVHDAILAKLRAPDRVVLVTGRMRPLDREDHERELAVVRAGQPRSAEPGTQFVVATQCIEAGADLDFDVLVTECASLDALVQRFGRLDRLGDHGEARGVVAIRSDHTGKDDDDAIYGGARVATWNHLAKLATKIDFGLAGNARAEAPPAVFPDARHAPMLLPSHLDLWSQTQPAPYPDPDIALWLHGPDRASRDVSIVWRADLTATADTHERLDDETLQQLLEASPPLRQEALTVPVWAAEAWLRGAPVDGVADVEGAVEGAADDQADRLTARWAIRWRGGDDGIEVLDLGAPGSAGLRVGDTLVVPSSYGGLRAGTWCPESDAPVTDRGDEAHWRQRRRLLVRVSAMSDPALAGASTDDAPFATLARRYVTAFEEGLDGATDEAWEAILASLARAAPPWLRTVGDVEFKPRILGTAGPLLLDGKVPKLVSRSSDETPEVSSDDDRASRTGVEVTLVDHLIHVEAYARAFATSRGAPATVVTDVALAAAWHDLGKIDPRFQLWLAGGDEVDLASPASPLAKSRMRDGDRARQRAARRRARYPEGARHELASVALLERADGVLAGAADRDLVLHLVASHHGWCRPFAPVEEAGPAVELTWSHSGHQFAASSDHGLASVSATVVERFWSMTQKYGWWGLAWLETLVRLADHRASQAEQEGAYDGGAR